MAASMATVCPYRGTQRRQILVSSPKPNKKSWMLLFWKSRNQVSAVIGLPAPLVFLSSHRGSRVAVFAGQLVRTKSHSEEQPTVRLGRAQSSELRAKDRLHDRQSRRTLQSAAPLLLADSLS